MPFTIIDNKVVPTDPILFISQLTPEEQYHSPKSEHVIKDVSIGNWAGDQNDGICIVGKRRVHVSNSVIYRTGMNPKDADELASAVQGADVIWYRCRFKDNGKGVLVGSGDTDLEDLITGQRSLFYECVFEGNSRRNPFVQIGQGYMINCLVRNWGRPNTFHEKSFGARAGSKAQLIISNTVFIQDDLTTCLTRGNFFSDIFNQYFWPFWYGPGFRRAAYADWGGHIQCYHCYKNHRWLKIENHRGKYMTDQAASKLIEHLSEVVPDNHPD